MDYIFRAYINQVMEKRDYENISQATDQSQPSAYIEII